MHLVTPQRRMPIGAEWDRQRGVSFRVWAPKCRRVRLHVIGSDGSQPDCYDMRPEGDGYYSTTVAACKPAARYGFLLDDGESVRGDPASRFQPDGIFGLSEVIDPAGFSWTDQRWRGVSPAGQVVYEMHV